jgi:predicted nucleic acid-binding protein
MQNAIISDTSCLILLDKIGELEILHTLYGNIITTQQVASEFGGILPGWIVIVNPVNKNYQTIIEASLDKGEASAIALAVEYDDCLLIIDDLKGRKFALQLGLQITGTLGVLIEAKSGGHIPFLKPILLRAVRYIHRTIGFAFLRGLRATGVSN